MVNFSKAMSMLYSVRLFNKFMEWYGDRPPLINIKFPFPFDNLNKNNIKKVKISYYFNKLRKK